MASRKVSFDGSLSSRDDMRDPLALSGGTVAESTEGLDSAPTPLKMQTSDTSACISNGTLLPVDSSAKEDPAVATKKEQIREACLTGDFAALQQLAEAEGGFMTDDLRRMAWPVLLGLPMDDSDQVDAEASGPATGLSDPWQDLPPHRDEDQVQLDVNRAFVHYPRYASLIEEARQKHALSDLIVEVLRRHPFLCYFQGFHDICQVFLLVLPPPLRTPAVVRLAVLRIRDFMLPTIDAAIQQLLLLPDILRVVDRPLWDHLRLAQHPRPFFALSGTLTMYAHDVESLGAIARLFDVLLARSPAFSLYIFAAIACAHRTALFATPADEPEMLHHILSKLPGRAGISPLPINQDSEDEKIGGGCEEPSLDALIAAAARLMADHPPDTLPAWRQISAASVLKTANEPLPAPPLPPGSTVTGYKRPLAADLTVADGERLFYEHVHDLERSEWRRKQRARVRLLLWQYRGSVQVVGAAVFVGVVAVLLRRYGGPSGPASRVSSLLARMGI